MYLVKRLLTLAKKHIGTMVFACIGIVGAAVLNLVTPALLRRFTASIEDIDTLTVQTLIVYAAVLLVAYLARALCRGLTLGEAHTLVCDLAEYEFAASVGYIGVMIYSEESVRFDLSRVTVYSDTKTDTELSELFDPAQGSADSAYDVYGLGALILIVVTISVVVCIFLVRRDREEREVTADSKTDRRGKNG